jgi:hypothetical protein
VSRCIDIRASYLTIYHAHLGAPLDPERDPYKLPGLPADARGVVKLWFVATFGNNDHILSDGLVRSPLSIERSMVTQ